ncbi:MAG: class I SAM-dependent methyltransferase [Rhodobacteraceae bacterium]|nr:class I SAM-dependent methyltransferase [Paracoccaceae bacterium]
MTGAGKPGRARHDLGNLRHAQVCRPTSIHLLRRLVEAVPVADRAGMLTGTFLDLGCGKGGTLHAARQIGFARAVGVEFVDAFADIAEANLRRLGVTGAEVVRGDAAACDPPAGLRFLFMFNPFGEAVMRPAMRRIAGVPARPLYIGHVYPEVEHVLAEELPVMEVVHDLPAWSARLFRVP